MISIGNTERQVLKEKLLNHSGHNESMNQTGKSNPCTLHCGTPKRLWPHSARTLTYTLHYGRLVEHTVRKFSSTNRSYFLKCDTNNIVEHYGKRIKILLGQPSKAHPCRISILLPKCSITFLATDIKELETIFALFYFLTFAQRVKCIFWDFPTFSCSSGRCKTIYRNKR